MKDTLIEAIARAIAEGQGDDFDHAHRDKPHWIETRGEAGGRFRDINEPRQPDYLDAAQAALTAITTAGYRVTPAEPTDEMIKIGGRICAGLSSGRASEPYEDDARHCYISMISAAQGGW